MSRKTDRSKEVEGRRRENGKEGEREYRTVQTMSVETVHRGGEGELERDKGSG